jgi:hypothetical protein
MVPVCDELPLFGYRADELTYRNYGLYFPESPKQHLKSATSRACLAHFRKRVPIQAISSIQKRLVPYYHHRKAIIYLAGGHCRKANKYAQGSTGAVSLSP